MTSYRVIRQSGSSKFSRTRLRLSVQVVSVAKYASQLMKGGVKLVSYPSKCFEIS